MKEIMSELKDLSTYSKDTPVGLPTIGGRAAVFVPTDLFDIANSSTIRKGAGIVGFGNPDGSLTIYFEANRFDDSALHKWENKARKAYDRMVAVAPTVSKAKMDAKFPTGRLYRWGRHHAEGAGPSDRLAEPVQRPGFRTGSGCGVVGKKIADEQ